MRKLLKKSIKIKLKLFLFFLIGFIFALKAPTYHNKYLYWKVGSQVVRVLNPKNLQSGGTGSHIEYKDGYAILTNKHVCEVKDKHNFVMIEKDGKLYDRKIIKESDKHDMCLIEPIFDSGISLGSAPSIGDEVYILGHPLLSPLNIEQGTYVSDYKVDICMEYDYETYTCSKMKSYFTYALNAISHPGNSGSPVVNEYGNLVGLLFAGGNVNFTFLVPFSYVKEFLNE